MSSIIDIHPHIVSPDTKKYPLDPLGGTQSTWSSERPTTYQTMLDAMDEAGVAKSAIVHSSTAYGYDNSYVADAVAAVPQRFTGVYSIDVLAPDAVKTFDYWLGRGCTGMRLFTTGSTLPDQAKWFADSKTYPFWEHAAARNIPVCMQMKQEGIPLLRQVMDRFRGDDDPRSCRECRSRTGRPMPRRRTFWRSPNTSRSISRSRRSMSARRAGARAARRHCSAK
jgi:predicted TIM-barrel fold metal-dependent hydrolase